MRACSKHPLRHPPSPSPMSPEAAREKVVPAKVRTLSGSMKDRGVRARAAARVLARAETGQKNAALFSLAELLLAEKRAILAANAVDMKEGREAKLEPALMDRLELNEERILAVADGVRQIANLPDPVGEFVDLKPRPSGIQVGRMRVPLGVIGIIYESRPNVTVDAAALCLKSGNASILRGGSESLNSNVALGRIMDKALRDAGLPGDAVQVIDTTDRKAVGELLTMPQYVDVVIPRGGKSLVEYVAEHAKVPVIKHLQGICHVYIDGQADLEKAIAVAVNAKMRRTGVCGAAETLLVDRAAAPTHLKPLVTMLLDAGCDRKSVV